MELFFPKLAGVKKAADAIDDFSNYLRGNIKSIGSYNKILFKEELKHVNYYLNLEIFLRHHFYHFF